MFFNFLYLHLGVTVFCLWWVGRQRCGAFSATELYSPISCTYIEVSLFSVCGGLEDDDGRPFQPLNCILQFLVLTLRCHCFLSVVVSKMMMWGISVGRGHTSFLAAVTFVEFMYLAFTCKPVEILVPFVEFMYLAFTCKLVENYHR